MVNTSNSVTCKACEATGRSLGVAELYEAFGLWCQLEGNYHGYDVLLKLVDCIAPLDFRVKVVAVGRDKIGYDKQQVGMPASILAHEGA